MLFAAFFRRWYGPGWADTFRQTKRYLDGLVQNFSILILIRTLFSPWKQMDAGTAGTQNLSDHFHHQLDKLVSRFVGFTVRSMTLLAACISFVVLFIIRTVWIVLWPILPLMIPLTLLYGLGAF